ncbi:tetratricopeptide repeat protein [Pelosinus propionicus]|uniref:Uncharacterized protein n=1 Tax=Pelosinus propionicus DSM 13327 TaxID=1123291 RepID=A0A1I4HDJ6_9FIRM|nr:hypothetical protein [Pelosinus propionicus]SFL39496.1 hypothetical protein SAMN04490355_1003108 [Pelosinus propionicus DSM 13327]
MQYIVITSLSIIFSACLLYFLMNKLLNVQLNLKPLILCVCCALLVNIVIPRIIIGFVGVVGTVGTLAFVAIGFAYSIAQYNEKFKMYSKESRGESETKSIINEVEPKDYRELCEKIKIVEITTVPISIVASTSSAENEIDIEFDLKEQIMIPEENDTNQVLLLENKVSSDRAATDVSILDPLASDFESEKQIVKPVYKKGEIERLYELNDEDRKFALGEKNKMVQVEDELQLSITAVDSSCKDLDSLIDSAFTYKEQRNFIQALIVFRQALGLYSNSEVAPFLVMEIGTILKNSGQYNEAINIFCEARKLPGVQKNTMFDLEFIKTIAYLRIVKNILLQHRLGDISFNNIPGSVLKEIDSEFREWRNLT